MRRLHRLLVSLSILVLATLSLATVAHAYDVTPVSDPATLGFSSSRLARIAAWQQTQVDAGTFSGAVAAIARNGKVAYLRAVGFRDRATLGSEQFVSGTSGSGGGFILNSSMCFL